MKLNLPYGRKNVSFRWSQLLKKELLTKHYVKSLLFVGGTTMIFEEEKYTLGKNTQDLAWEDLCLRG